MYGSMIAYVLLLPSCTGWHCTLADGQILRRRLRLSVSDRSAPKAAAAGRGRSLPNSMSDKRGLLLLAEPGRLQVLSRAAAGACSGEANVLLRVALILSDRFTVG